VKHDEFIGQVQARARLDSRGAAETATRATLETLAERIPSELASSFAAELPREIGEHLRRVAAGADLPVQGERFDRREFIARVADRSGADEPKAAHEVRAVMEVVGEAISEGALNKVLASLPEDVTGLLTAGSKGAV
jgi:uncharacterized protein (DUF2267 family)